MLAGCARPAGRRAARLPAGLQPGQWPLVPGGPGPWRHHLAGGAGGRGGAVVRGVSRAPGDDHLGGGGPVPRRPSAAGARQSLARRRVPGPDGPGLQRAGGRLAGIGGVIVTLTSSNPAAAAVPAVVTVPFGSLTVAFPIITFPVAATTPVTISALSPLGTASATLLVSSPGQPLPAVPVPVRS